MSLTEEQKQIIKSTAPILKENGKEITSIFYKQLFKAHPELLNMFNQTNQKIGTQPLALANTVYFAAENIDDLGVLMPQIQHIAHKHRALMVQSEHYPIVGKYLLQAIKEFLADKATSEILDAWSDTYNIIASIFINIEKNLYDKFNQDPRDKGFNSFTIVKKEKIANGPIISFKLERTNGGKMYNYHPGQYLTLHVKKGNYYHNRHYSLTQSFDGRSYCIAIKQENDRQPKGIISNEIINNYRIGDKILASFPAGTFSLIKDAKHHLFIASGVGITVFSSLIQTLYKKGKSNIVTLIHCVPSQGHAAFASQMRSILNPNQYHLLLQGRYLLQNLINDIIKQDTHVYICGSTSFMNKVQDYLIECNHPMSHIHTESFRPSLSLIKNAVKNQSNTKSL
ncbi:unnamed protein product [Adineta steineri]|uniref:nitric oxide dioxygenase n=1 Tax=Adineta steineri TaxID=433720 RepID=A0A819CRU0_9BILA|nr:unnamed protein product [Adineta steineri]CAF3820245.1 unnamed protein product [Adineta steineri]